jgi:AraC-like DNA-binding protein
MATDSRGILRPGEGFEHFRLTRRDPSPDLAPFAERHWIVEWDLRGREPYVQELLPHPSFHLVVEADGTRLYGVGADRDQRRIEGVGRAVGVKFRPGGAHPFVGVPAWTMTGRSVPAREAFGADVPVRDAVDDQVAALEAFLRERLPEPDANLATIGRVVASMLDEPEIARVEELAARHGLSTRTLQRLFRTHVGVSPKWVLKRYRLHVAAERLADASAADGAAAARELGYFDQAHFINDFKAGVGRSPRDYAATARR